MSKESQQSVSQCLESLNKLKELLDDYEQENNKETLKTILVCFHQLELQMRDLSNKNDVQKEFKEIGLEMKKVIERVKKIGSSNNTNSSSGQNSSNNEEILAKPKMLEGYLKKQGDKGLVKSYKQRYFKQVDDKLYYYLKNGNSLELPQGHIDISQITNVYTTEKGFDIETPNRVYHLQDITGNSMQWIKGIQKWKEYKKNVEQNGSEKTNRNSGSVGLENDANTNDVQHNPQNNQTSPVISKDRKSIHDSPPPTFNLQSIEIDEDKEDQYIVHHERMHKHKRLSTRTNYDSLEKKELVEHLHRKDVHIKSLNEEIKKLLHEISKKDSSAETAKSDKTRIEISYNELMLQNELTKDYVQSLVEEIKNKDVLINSLQDKIKEGKLESVKSKQEMDLNYKKEYKKQKEMSHSQQIRLRHFSDRVNELEEELKFSRLSLKRMDEHYQNLLKENSEYVNETRKHILTSEDPKLYLLGELEEVRERYFYSLALGIKLNCPNGTKSNSNIQDLYDKAKHLPYKSWHHFLLKNLQFENEEELQKFTLMK